MPAQEILNFVQPGGNPLLVIGTHAVGGMERFVLGSTAEEVLRQAHCPVMTVGPHVTVPTCVTPHFHRILYATDFSASSLAALPLVAAFQRPSCAALRVFHVARDAELETSAEEHRFNPLRNTLQEYRNHHIGREEYVVSHESVVSRGIVTQAEGYAADLLILGVHRASAYAAHASPKIAFQTIAAAPCPVLTVSS